jgi:hypothetical protein
MDIKFIGGTGKSRSSAVDGQDTVNYYLEFNPVSIDGVNAKASCVLFPTPGLLPFYVNPNTPVATPLSYGSNYPYGKSIYIDATAAVPTVSGVVRCLYTTSTGRMFSVTGNQLIEYSQYGQKTIRGQLKTTTGTVSMTDCGNGSQRGYGLCIVDGQYGYNYNLTNNIFEQIKDVAFPKASIVVFYNGYFIVNELNSARFWFSQLYDCLDWSDLQAQYNITQQISLQTGLLTVILATSTIVNAGSFDVSTTYTIVTVGTTDFTLVGAKDNNIGTIFTASGPGSGTGTASFNPLINATIDANSPCTLVSPNAYLSGVVQVFNPSTGVLQINITSFGGTGSSSSWTINIFVAGSTRFYTAEGTPDNLKTIATIRNELWLIGDISTEVWYMSNTVGNPFVRSNAFINNGTVASDSVVTNGNNLFWLGSSAAGHGQVWMTNNYQPIKISTNSIDHDIESLPNIQDAQGFCYTQEGHEFYVLSFNAGNKTLVYDLSTQEWHERAYWDSSKAKFERYLPNTHCLFSGVNYVGDYRNSNIYSLDLNTYTDNGNIVRRVRTGPHVHDDRRRLYFREFEIDIERGVGVDGIDTSSNPMAFLTWSDDGGFTWSNEYWGKLGGRGEYLTRLHWHRLGHSRDRIFRLVVTDPVKVVLISARADVTVET